MIEVRPTALLRYHAYTCWKLTLTYDLDLQSQASSGHDPTHNTHTHKFRGQSVQKTEWKQTDGQTDKQTDGTNLFTFPTNAVGKIIKLRGYVIVCGCEMRLIQFSDGNSSLTTAVRTECLDTTTAFGDCLYAEHYKRSINHSVHKHNV